MSLLSRRSLLTAFAIAGYRIGGEPLFSPNANEPGA